MWLVGALGIAVVVAVAVAVLGGEGKETGSSASVEDGKGQEWRVELLATPDEQPVGEAVRVDVSVTNTTQVNQSLTFPDGEQLRLTAENERGEVVWEAEQTQQRFLLTRSVNGGAQVEYSFPWPTEGAEPGEYTLKASVLSEELKERAKVEAPVVLR